MTRTLYVVVAVAIACGPASTAVSRFDNDYESARLQAVKARLPLAVEVWAPW
jgi:hypothetical protein